VRSGASSFAVCYGQIADLALELMFYFSPEVFLLFYPHFICIIIMYGLVLGDTENFF